MNDEPTKAFRDWWEPWGFDQVTGASVGGHPDAYRMWSRQEPNGSRTRRMYGTRTKSAWLSDIYREEFDDWKRAGFPARDDFVSISAPATEQGSWLKGMKPSQIGGA